MAKDLVKLLAQKPTWIHVDEPVSGSTNPSAQDATVLPDGTIIHNVEGVNNRVAAQMWGSLKLMSEIIDRSHNVDGTHSITNADVDANAAIDEAKIAFGFEGVARPTGGVYSTTADLAAEIAHWAPFYTIARNLANTNQALLERNNNAAMKPNGWVGRPFMDVQGQESVVKVAENEQFWLNGRRFRLNGSFNAGSDCVFNIGASSKDPANGMSRTFAVWLEFVIMNATASGIVFPYGNTQYRNAASAAGTHGLAYAHSDQGVALTNEPAFLALLTDSDNNIYVGADGNVYQVCYMLRGEYVDYASYKNGLSDSNLRSLNNQLFVPDVKNSGNYIAADQTSTAQPLAIIVRTNQGAYHDSINPAGCAQPRVGVTLTSFNDCFDKTKIRYYTDLGVECPNYVGATYSSAADTYTLSGTIYYRSGLNRNGKSGNVEGSLADIINSQDVDCMKPRSVMSHRIGDEMIGRALAGKLQNALTPLFYGTVGSTNESGFYKRRPLQAIGFGSSEAAVFGTNNLAGVFIDQTNNGRTGVLDTIRYQWTDKLNLMRVALRFTEGNDGSESKPALLTYEATSQTLAFNTTGLSGMPLVANVQPIMRWANGNTVVLATAWSGLGTSSCSCVINVADAAAHAGQNCYMELQLSYHQGGGVPYMLKQCLKAQDAAGTEYSVIDTATLDTNFSFVGAATTGSSVSQLAFPSTASTVTDAYKDQYVMILTGTNSAGTVRKITSYDGSTRRAQLDTPLAQAPANGDKFTVSKLHTGSGTIVVDAYSRGVMGNVRRDYMTADGQGVVALGRPIISASRGTVAGTVITGLNASEVVDVIFYDDTPFQSKLKLWFRNEYNAHCFKELVNVGNFEFIDIGSAFVSNVGSANDGSRTYMGIMPSVHFPNIDGVKWIGTITGATSLMTSIGSAKNLSWTTIIPFSGMRMDYSNLMTEMDLDGVPLSLSSESMVADQHAGIIAVLSLIKDASGYKLLLAMTQNGALDYSVRSKLRTFDLNKFVGDTHEG